MSGEALDLGDGAASQRPGWHHALERLRVLGADEPDPVPSGELDVVRSAAQHVRILVRAADAVAALVHVEEDVLVVAEVVAVAHGAVELLLREPLGCLAAVELPELGERLGEVHVDAKRLDVPAQHHPLDERGHVPPVLQPGVCPASEDAGGRREWSVAEELAAGLGRAVVERSALRVVDEPGLVDAGFRRRDVGLVSGGIGARRSARRGVRRSALHGRGRDQLLGQRALAGHERLRPAGRLLRRTASFRPTPEVRHLFSSSGPYRVVVPVPTPHRMRGLGTARDAAHANTSAEQFSLRPTPSFVVSTDARTLVASSASVMSASGATSR